MDYIILHGNGDSCVPGTITKNFPDDKIAKEFVKRLVKDGLRNQAWANVELSDGHCYVAQNTNGKVTAKNT